MSICAACDGKGYYQPPAPLVADKYLYQPMPKDRPMHTGDRIKELEEEVDDMHKVICWLVECCERWPCFVGLSPPTSTFIVACH